VGFYFGFKKDKKKHILQGEKKNTSFFLFVIEDEINTYKLVQEK